MKKTSDRGMKNENISNQRPLDLATREIDKVLHETIIRKFEKRKVHWPLKDNIWRADLADVQLISNFNKGSRFLLCVTDIFSKYTWFISLKDKKGITITNAFQKVLNKSNRKPRKKWVNKGREFYNGSMKSWSEKNYIEIHSTRNEVKSIVGKRFIRTLRNKIYKYMISISKNMYIDKLDDVVSKCNNRYYITIKSEPAHVNSSHILILRTKIIAKVLNLKLVIMLEYQNIKIFLQKAVFEIVLKKFLLLKRFKKLSRGHMLLVIVTEKKLL